MALEISAVSNVSFAAAASRAVTALNSSPSIPGITAAADSVFAPDGATFGRFVEVRAVLNRANSRTALQLAVTAGNGNVAGPALVKIFYSIEQFFFCCCSTYVNE